MKKIDVSRIFRKSSYLLSSWRYKSLIIRIPMHASAWLSVLRSNFNYEIIQEIILLKSWSSLEVDDLVPTTPSIIFIDGGSMLLLADEVLLEFELRKDSIWITFGMLLGTQIVFLFFIFFGSFL
jgi:hypothetical protein